MSSAILGAISFVHIAVALAAEDASPYQAAFRDGDILFARHPAPSPDGSQVAFCYQGDLWVVSALGGDARRLTAHPGIESYPVWSPDGGWIAFSSDRNGNDDVYALPLEGGAVRQLTFDSDPDHVSDWTPDSRAVIVHSRRHVLDGREPGLWWVPLDGGMPGWIQPIGGELGRLSPDGTRLAFVRGSTEWTRRGYEGEARNRIYVHDLGAPLLGASLQELAVPAAVDANAHTLIGLFADTSLRPGGRYLDITGLAAEAGERRSQHDRAKSPDFDHPEREYGSNTHPAWFPDGRHLLYLSEIHGVANLKVVEVATGSRAWVTRFQDGDGRLRHPALSRDGSLAAFEYDDGIFLVDVPRQLPSSGSTAWPTAPSAPRRLSIQLPLDQRVASVARVSVKGEADELALSPDDEQIAFVANGDVLAMKASEDEPWAYALAAEPSREQEIEWAPDSKSLVFVSDREGNHDLYTVRSSDEKEPRLARSLRLETTRLTSDQRDEHRPRYSPDGKRIAFLRGLGTLVTIAPDGSDEQVLVDGWSDLDYSWSPDGKWIAYVQEDDDFNSDIFLIPADGSRPPYNLTRHPDNEQAPFWSADGRILAFVSTRRHPNEQDIWFVRLSREDDELAKEDRLDAEDKKKEKGGKGKEKEKEKGPGEGSPESDTESSAKSDSLPVVRIDFEDLHERVQRLTSLPGEENRVWVTPDGKEFVFTTDTDGKTDLWKIRWDGEEEKRLTQGGTDPREVQFDSEGKRLFFLKQGGAIQSISVEGGDAETYPYEAEIDIDRPARRIAVFEEAWREIRNRFYDPGLHGADWDRIHETYRIWAGAASTYRDFHDVLKLLLGEVGASHMNVWGGPGDWSGESFAPDERLAGLGARPEGPWDAEPWGVRLDDGRRLRLPSDAGIEADPDPLRASTADLGLLFDPTFAGPGLRVRHVVERGPADRVASAIRPGEVILTVEKTPVGPATNLAVLLDRKSGRRVAVEVQGEDGQRRTVVVRPVERSELRRLLYAMLVKKRQAEVERRSDGRVAYIHIQSMNEASLEAFERDLYAVAHGKDALIIDVRDNGGGWTTDLLMTSLAAADHATTVPRGGGEGYPQDRRLLYAWTRPIVVLCNENSYSNAEIFSWAVQATGRGPVVGAQTYGAVISTGGMYLGDGTWLRLPFRGWYSKKDGTNMESRGCLPDVVVRNELVPLAEGSDQQLQEAVRLAGDFR